MGMGMKLINTMPKVSYDPDKIGTFYVEYTFWEDWDQTDETEMGDWLAEHCTKNHIYAKTVSTTLGGGCMPINSRWLRRKKQRAKNIMHPDDQWTYWYIRLNREDDVLFKLTWLSDL